ncbi:MAG: cobalt chelatase [Pseudomonadota bacterium]
MKSPRSHKQQQQATELCGAAIRALTGESALRHRGRSLFLDGKRVSTGAPHSNPDPIRDSFHSHRGAADGVAMRLLHSDTELHAKMSPEPPLARLIFDLLEQLRVETLTDAKYPGIKKNLQNRFREWSRQFHDDGQAEGEIGILFYTVAQVVWSRLNGTPTFEETDDLIEVTRGKISPVIGHALVHLKKHRSDQQVYSQYALEIANILDHSLTTLMQTEASGDTPDNEKELARITLSIDDSEESEDSNIASIVTGSSKVLAQHFQEYRIYNREFDRQIVAASQVRADELREFREKLDAMVFHQGINVPRLSRQISQLLATPRRDGWLFGEEEGLIDGRRLTQVVANPAERRLFVKDQYRYRNDCLVSFLIDCSGSMKQSIDYIAMLTDIFGRALDQAEIASEILGFTTGNWNGGKVYQKWLAEGRPENPGRLNEQCHLIFKTASNSWRRSRKDISALFKTTHFREGLDGEAVEWACQRMMRREENRKILMVISDGSPMDSATSLANDEFYLDNHLKHMVEKYDQRSGIEIYGIGVGLSLTPYYQHSLAIDLSESLSNHVFLQILQMIRNAQRR